MFHSLMMLAIDANHVIGLRVTKLMLGGRSARREPQLMVSEKIDAAFEASASLMAGASGDEIVRGYRVLAETRSDSWCLVERSGFVVRRDQAAIIFSLAIGIASRKVCIGVLPKHQRP